MSRDWVSWANDRAEEKTMARSTANVEVEIAFTKYMIVSWFWLTSRSVKFSILLCRLDIAPRPPRDVFLLIQRELPANLCRRAEYE